MSYFEKVKIVDAEGHNLGLESSGYATTIGIDHHEIHDGYHFIFSDEIQFATSGLSGAWLLDTPATSSVSATEHGNSVHLVYTFSVDTAAKVELYAEAACATSGTLAPAYNSDRANPTACGCTWYRLPRNHKFWLKING